MTSDTPLTTASKWWWKFCVVCSPVKSCAKTSPLCVTGCLISTIFRGLGVLLRQGLVGPLPALPEAALTYLFETKLAVASFHGSGYRPEVAALFGLLFVHVNGRTKVTTQRRRKMHQVGVFFFFFPLFSFRVLVPACCGRLRGRKSVRELKLVPCVRNTWTLH